MIRLCLCLSILLELLLFSKLWANDNSCLSTHVREAVELNQERKELYRENFGKKVSALFGKFIFIEKIMLGFTKRFDRKSTPYREKGIPLFCQELAPISLTPAFMVQRPEANSQIAVMSGAAIDKLKNETKKLFKSESFPSYPLTRNFLNSKIHELEKNPNQQCLVRHFLESISASMREIPSYEETIVREGLKSSKKLFIEHIQNQLMALKFMAWFDRKALPYQLQGIGIFCQDIPPIQYH